MTERLPDQSRQSADHARERGADSRPRRIGRLEVSVAGLGTNNFGRRLDEVGSRAVVAEALASGVTFFDTADIYGDGQSEEFLGRALRGRRDQAVVTTKFGMGRPPDGPTGGHPDYVRRACQDSLRRLGMERIDLYLYHRPDPATPIGETLGAMNELLERGLVREIGCSNFAPEQLVEADRVAREQGLRGFAVVQNEYNLLRRAPEGGLLQACERLGVAFVPYFPLAMGLLTGKYRRGLPAPEGARLVDEPFVAERLADVERLQTYATDHGHTLVELALSWLAGRPQVASVIAGAMSPAQVRANVAATSAWSLSEGERAEIDGLVRRPD